MCTLSRYLRSSCSMLWFFARPSQKAANDSVCDPTLFHSTCNRLSVLLHARTRPRWATMGPFILLPLNFRVMTAVPSQSASRIPSRPFGNSMQSLISRVLIVALDTKVCAIISQIGIIIDRQDNRSSPVVLRNTICFFSYEFLILISPYDSARTWIAKVYPFLDPFLYRDAVMLFRRNENSMILNFVQLCNQTYWNWNSAFDFFLPNSSG